MKRFYLFFTVIAALAMNAQETVWTSLDVGDWDNPTTYNGSYFDMAPTNFYLAHTGVQMLYTPDMLADMLGKENVIINQLTFRFYCESFEEITREIVVFLQEIDATEFAVNDEGVKQFFPIEGEPAMVEQRTISLLDLYGEDVELSFRFNAPYTPGKSLLVTMAFDAQEDDNCTMGSDYAPFYTSGMGKAMTYTNNSTSFYDFTLGEDFPNATASLGCGTNVELPLTRIGYRYEESTAPSIVPANPTADSWYDCGDESGFSKFYFTLPTTDVDGNLLDRENLSYAVWINDGNGNVYQFTFPAEDYTFDLEEEDINEVPYYLYSNAVDFHDYYVYMYRTNEPGYEPLFVRDEDHDGNIGIQAIYYSDRAVGKSEISWLYDEVTPPEPPTPTEQCAKPDGGYVNGADFHGVTVTLTNNEEAEGSELHYSVTKDGVVVTEDAVYDGPFALTEDGEYQIDFWATAPNMLDSTHGGLIFTIDEETGLSELLNGKTIANVRYFNMAGQEMQEANGMTIVVTTYTDGTTSAAKVVK